MFHRLSSVLTGIAIAIAAVALSASPASAKSYQMDKVDITATLNPDASMDVVEHITYVFDGEYHNATRTIPPGDYEITNMTVTENGKLVNFEGPPYKLAWHFDALDETRTFDVSYHVNRAARIGSDVAELYWKWRGTEHPEINHFKAVLTVPPAEGIRAWTHGPLNGTIRVESNVITSEVSPLPASTFVETRVADPSNAFTATPGTPARLPTILAEETQNANNANATRAQWETTQEEDKHPWALPLNVLAVIATIASAALFYYLWSRWGKDPKRPENIGKYWYEPPTEAPAIVVATLTRGASSIEGTLLDLAQRGFIRIEEFENDEGIKHKIFGSSQDWRITKVKDPEKLQSFERRLFDYFFKDGDEVTQSELKERAKDNPEAARSFLSSFKNAIEKKVDGIYWKDTTLVMGANIVNALALAGIGFLAVVNLAVLGAIALVAAIPIGILTYLLRCRTELGAQKAAEWQGLRNYMKDFGNFKDAPVGHLILWEWYLVFAVALGVAKELSNGLKARVPDLQDNNDFATWYVASSGTSDLARFASIGAFTSGLNSSVSPPSQSSDSSGFSGGGFSSGGGGGGGGGGDGAS